MKKLIIAILGSLLSTSLLAEEVLFCTDELSTGFKKIDSNWEEVNFKPSRFTVKVDSQFETIIIDDEVYMCFTPYPGTEREQFHICNEMGGFSFRYSTETKKFIFIRSSSFGYIYSNNDTDAIIAGKCEKF